MSGSVNLLQRGILHEYQTDRYLQQHWCSGIVYNIRNRIEIILKVVSGQAPLRMEKDSFHQTQGIMEIFQIHSNEIFQMNLTNQIVILIMTKQILHFVN